MNRDDPISRLTARIEQRSRDIETLALRIRDAARMIKELEAQEH